MTCPYPVRLQTASSAFIQFDDTDDGYAQWTWSDLPGWLGTNVDQELQNPSGWDGAVLARERRGPRTMSLVGVGAVENGDDWWEAANRLEAITDELVDDDGLLIVFEPTGAKAVTVRLGTGGLGIGRRGALRQVGHTGRKTAVVSFIIPLTAAIPTKTAWP